MKLDLNVSCRRLTGYSGISHVVEVADVGGRSFLLVRVTRYTQVVDLLSKLVIAFDLGMPPLLLVEDEGRLPRDLLESVKMMNGVVMRVGCRGLAKRTASC